MRPKGPLLTRQNVNAGAPICRLAPNVNKLRAHHQKCRARDWPALGPVSRHIIADMANGMPSIPVMIIANDIPNPLNM